MSGFSTIKHDTSTEGAGGSGTSATWSHTIGAGANRLIVVCASFVSGEDFTGATYGGVAMTEAVKATLTSGTNYRSIIYYLKNPPVGSADVVVSFSGSSAWCGGSSSWFNVYQADVLDATDTDNAGSGAPTNVLTVVENGLVIDSLVSGSDTETNPTAGQTTIYSDTISSGDSGGSTYKIITTSASTTMSWDASGGNGWAKCSASFNPGILEGGSFLLNLV